MLATLEPKTLPTAMSGEPIIKHGNPCGAALGADPATAFHRALECDPVSAFGGVIAFNREIDGDTARAISKAFYEAVIAPRFDDDALDVLGKKKKLRLLAIGEPEQLPIGIVAQSLAMVEYVPSIVVIVLSFVEVLIFHKC